MDTDTSKSELYLLTMVFLNGARLIAQLLTLEKQLRKGEITKENLETSYAVTTLLKLDRYVSAFLEKIKKKY